MILSAVLMAIIGLATSFLPHELLAAIGADVSTQTIIIVQVLGALYLAFAMLNWAARGVLIGGIYSRPLAVGNFMHFAIVSITLVKAAMALNSSSLAAAALVYVLFATWFGLVLFRPPVS